VAVTRRTFKPAAVLPVRRRQQLELGEGAARSAQLSFGRRDERAGDAAPLVRLAYRESAPLAHPLSRGQAVLRHTQIELHAADHLASAVGVAVGVARASEKQRIGIEQALHVRLHEPVERSLCGVRDDALFALLVDGVDHVCQPRHVDRAAACDFHTLGAHEPRRQE